MLVCCAFRFDLAGLIGGGVKLFRWRNMHVDGVLAFQKQSIGWVLCLERGELELDIHMDPNFFLDYTGSVMLKLSAFV